MAPVADSGSETRARGRVASARDVLSAKRVYGDPYEKNGLSVIPAAVVGGIAGGTAGGRADGDSAGERGYGLIARPSGAWIIRDDEVTWKPAIDGNLIILGGQIIVFTAVYMVARNRGSRSKPSLVGVAARALGDLLRARRRSRHS